jgi:hypothetical protein
MQQPNYARSQSRYARFRSPGTLSRTWRDRISIVVQASSAAWHIYARHRRWCETCMRRQHVLELMWLMHAAAHSWDVCRFIRCSRVARSVNAVYIVKRHIITWHERDWVIIDLVEYIWGDESAVMSSMGYQYRECSTSTTYVAAVAASHRLLSRCYWL